MNAGLAWKACRILFFATSPFRVNPGRSAETSDLLAARRSDRGFGSEQEMALVALDGHGLRGRRGLREKGVADRL
jgi:diaminopimelate decarboxylase